MRTINCQLCHLACGKIDDAGRIYLHPRVISAEHTYSWFRSSYHIVDPDLLIRRINLTACKVVDENDTAPVGTAGEQLDLFTDYEELERRQAEEQAALEKERHKQLAVLELKKRYGKNIILKGMNLEEDATARDRNAQIGGHKA